MTVVLRISYTSQQGKFNVTLKWIAEGTKTIRLPQGFSLVIVKLTCTCVSVKEDELESEMWPWQGQIKEEAVAPELHHGRSRTRGRVVWGHRRHCSVSDGRIAAGIMICPILTIRYFSHTLMEFLKMFNSTSGWADSRMAIKVHKLLRPQKTRLGHNLKSRPPSDVVPGECLVVLLHLGHQQTMQQTHERPLLQLFISSFTRYVDVMQKCEQQRIMVREWAVIIWWIWW